MEYYTVLIVEDEELIANTLQRYLKRKGHQVLGIANSYEEAEALYLQQRPDVALLDIKLNGSKTGIDFGEFLQAQTDPVPFIYLTSQFDGDSINRAKATFPAGYLPKPVHKNTLYTTLEIAMHSHLAQKKAKNITLSSGSERYSVAIDDILYLQAEHIYVRVYVADRKRAIIVRSTLKDLLATLPAQQFMQTHRSYAINIKKINRWDNQQVHLGDQSVPVSRARKKEIMKQIG